MSLEAGQDLLHYRLIERIGEGGMGIVWKAHDTTLERDVAIKFLPEELAGDPARLTRFEREARLLASLNHPNIAAVYGLHQAGAVRFIAMELVDGEDLAARLQRGPLPVDEAIEMARALAEGLEAAHELGVIHRDLKPANIRMTPDGKVKVLDLGLAKALDRGVSPGSSDSSMSPTVTSTGTLAGVILGTAAYMSPEQAKGRLVDRRADIWAFGVVLFEALTAQRLFHGESISETLAAVLMAEPDLNRLPPAVPHSVRHLLSRCLEREPRSRLRDIGEARVMLERARADGAATDPGSTEAPGKARSVWPWAAIGLLVGAAGVLLWPGALGPSGQAVEDTSHVAVPLAPSVGLPVGPDASPEAFRLSPDGRTLAFISYPAGGGDDDRTVMIRRLGQRRSVALPATRGADGLFFSPDGQSIGFIAENAIRRIPVGGGPVQTLLARSGDLLRERTIVAKRLGPTASWSDTVGIVFSSRSGDGAVPGLWRMDPDGGNVEQLLSWADAPRLADLSWPEALPDGRGVIFTRRFASSPGRSRVEVLSLADGSTRELASGILGRYMPGGYLLYTRDGKLFAVPFDTERLELSGAPQLMMEGLLTEVTGESLYAVSATGTLAHISGGATRGKTGNLLWVEDNGNSISVDAQPRAYFDLRISPDGSRLAFSDAAAGNDIWVHDFARQTQSRLTIAAGEDETPVWSPDGQWLAYSSSRADQPRTLHRQRADGSGEEKLVWQGDEHLHVSSWTADGMTLLVDVATDAGADVWAIAVDGESDPQTVLGDPFTEMHARLSPDGRWLAYTSTESASPQVYVRRYPELDRKIQISSTTGSQPVWSRTARQLYYRDQSRLWVVDARLAEDATFSRPRLLFERDYGTGKAFSHFSYDVAADGRLLMTLRDSASFPPSIGLALRWDLELAGRFER